MSIAAKIGTTSLRFVLAILMVVVVFLMRATMVNDTPPSGATYLLAGFLLVLVYLALRFVAPINLSQGPAWVRLTNSISIMLIFAGLLAILSGHSTVGQVLLYPSLIAFGISFGRLDLMIVDMQREAKEKMGRRLAVGGAGFVGVILLALLSGAPLNAGVFEVALFVLVVVLGFMTAAPRVVGLQQYFMVLAGNEPAPIRQDPGEMIFDHGQANYQMGRSFAHLVFYLYFAIVVLATGVIAVPYYAYLLISGNARHAEPDQTE